MHKLLIAVLTSGIALSQTSTPAEEKIAGAMKQIQSGVKTSQVYNELADAYNRRARETGDPSFYRKALESLDTSLKLTPGDYEAQKIRVPALLAIRRFDEALALATKVNKRVPDDIAGWGLLADANMALGNYADAEKQVQWMLDLRPGAAPGFIKAAQLREVFGDPEGAMEFFDEGFRRTPQQETEERAWLTTHKAHQKVILGEWKSASGLLDQALATFPGYHLALAELASVRMAEGKFADAAALLEKAEKTAPVLFAYANALGASGRKDEADAAYRMLEEKGAATTELVFYYADVRNDPAKALAAAEREYALRHDVATLDAYAWALYKSGKVDEAKKQMERCLATGVKEPSYLKHAAAMGVSSGS